MDDIDGTVPRAFSRNSVKAIDHFLDGKPLRPLVQWRCNQVVGNAPIGKRSWTKRLLGATRTYEFPALKDVIGTTENPIEPSFWDRQSAYRKLLAAEELDQISPKDRRDAIALSPRVRKGSEKLLECDIEHCAFTCIVTSVQPTKEAAHLAVTHDSLKLSRAIRRRFPNAICVLVFEIDLVRVGNVNAALLPIPRWKDEFSKNQLAYKVHVHGVIYVPGMTPDQIQTALQTTPSGKRSKFYSGSNQVRCLPVDPEPNAEEDMPDIYGCMGYAEKRHYRPADHNAMFDNFPQWLWLIDQMEKTSKTVITIGVNSKRDSIVDSYEDVSHSAVDTDNIDLPDGIVDADVRSNLISSTANGSSSYLISAVPVSSDLYTSFLNSPFVTDCINLANRALKKLLRWRRPMPLWSNARRAEPENSLGP